MPNRLGCRHVAMVRRLPIHVWPHEDVLAEMGEHIRNSRCAKHISITSSELMFNTVRNPLLSEYIQNAGFSLCDSMGVVLAGAVQGARVRRFTGPLLMEKSCEFGISQHWRHFFCGGAEGLALLLSHRLTARFPGLITAGIFCPPFRGLGNEEERRMIETINTAEPDILWVGLGVVRQELWIARYRGRLTVPWLVGVGGAFDYHAGTTPWAPKWVRRAGMEWMYRLCKEPWRFKRILSCYINLLEATLETALRRPVVLGNWRVDQPPQYRGRAKRPAHC